MRSAILFFLIQCIFCNAVEIPFVAHTTQLEQFLSPNPDGIALQAQETIEEFQVGVEDLLQEEDVFFENTLKKWDLVAGKLHWLLSFYEGLSLVHSDEHLRTECERGSNALKSVFFDTIATHPQLYQVAQEVQQHPLNPKEMYYTKELIAFLKKNGAHLAEEIRLEVSELQQEISDLEVAFEKNIRESSQVLWVAYEDLMGLDSSFIHSLQRDEQGLYRLSCEYPIYFPVMEQAVSSQVRKDLFHLFNNRGYPQNQPILQQLIAKRDRLAKILGFSSFAQYDLQDQMIQSLERAEGFLQEIFLGSLQAYHASHQELCQGFSEQGKLFPWDIPFLKGAYKQKKWNVQSQKIAEYFPLDRVIEKMGNIYATFFHLSIESVPVTLWDREVKCLQVSEGGTLLGYVVLDLFPRENKYSHAAETTLLPAFASYPAVSLVMANFPNNMADRPSLLTHDQIKTLFHEFGHALHDILGRGDFLMTAGAKGKIDFIELPSQLFEEWTIDADILQEMSCHYLTGEPLSLQQIDDMRMARNYENSFALNRMCYLSNLSLEYFKEGMDKDIDAIALALQEAMLPAQIADPDSRFQYGFGHLTTYGAKYYGYLWSRVFAADVFSKIQEEGILNPEIGTLYRNAVIGQGGNQDPNDMLRNFLRREPSAEAFLKELQ